MTDGGERMTTPGDDVPADPQSIIAALRQQLDEQRTERDAALAEKAAYAERLMIREIENNALLARQTASAEVLKVISASPDNTQPVFELIARRARELCGASRASVTEYDGGLLHMRARDGYDKTTAMLGDQDWPRPAGSETIHGRAVQKAGVVHIHDVSDDDTYGDRSREVMRRLGSRSLLGVPLLRDGRAIGAISLGRKETGGFDAGQIKLVQSFAAQAVIAMENARLLGELRQLTGDLQESLEYQTATSDVLNVISHTTFDLQPVLRMVAETAARLCVAETAAIFRREGNMRYLATNVGFPPEYEGYWNEIGPHPVDAASPTAGMRALVERRVVHVPDVAAVPGYSEAAGIRHGKMRTSLGVPLLREGEPIGVIVLARQRVEPFTDRQIELVKTFADQAVIAIENTRLLTEQREALERQTATAEVLQVINASPGDLKPVFNAVLERALRLCEASFGALTLYDGETVERVALLGIPPAFAEYALRNPLTKNAILVARGIATRKPVLATDVMIDMAASPDVRDALVQLGGVRALLQVPLLKDGEVVGFIAIFRAEPGAFPDKQITLLESFAAQAVIAMENARLLEEIRAARDAAEEASRTIEAAYRDLKAAQANLIQAEKMASLGQLTAGIAHEIKNPLNFVNNFADLSVELLAELKETAAPGFAALDEDILAGVAAAPRVLRPPRHRHASASRTAARASTPARQSTSSACSAGLWETPVGLRTKTIAVGTAEARMPAS